jgi:hypothetical protein
MSQKEKIIIAVLVLIAVVLGIVFIIRGVSPQTPGLETPPGQTGTASLGTYANGQIVKVDGNLLTLNNGWLITTGPDTKISTRIFRDPKQYSAALGAYQDAQAQGTATGTAPLPYKDTPFALTDVRVGYRLAAFLNGQIATGTVSAANVTEVLIFPSVTPAPAYKPYTLAAVVKSVQGNSVLADSGYEFQIGSATPVSNIVLKDPSNPKGAYTESKASFSDIKLGAHLLFTLNSPIVDKKASVGQILSVQIAPL